MAAHTTSTTSNPNNLPEIYWPSSHWAAKAERTRRNAARQSDPRLAAAYERFAQQHDYRAYVQAQKGL